MCDLALAGKASSGMSAVIPIPNPLPTSYPLPQRKLEELQAAAPKPAAPRAAKVPTKRGRKKKAAAEVVAEEAGAEGTAGDSKTAPGDDREPGTGAGAAPESDQPPTVIADGSGSGEPGRMEAGSDLEKEAASGEDAVNGGGLASARETTNSSAVESSSTH